MTGSAERLAALDPLRRELVERVLAQRAGGIVGVGRGRRLPLSFAQQRLWFLDHLAPGTAYYNMPYAYRVTGELDIPALRWAFSDLVARHEPLRTRYEVDGGVAYQVIDPPAPIDLPLVDLSASPSEEVAKTLADEEAATPFDLARDPMLRAQVLRLADQDHVLLFTVHHIASDGWSAGVLARDLTALYRAHHRREPVTLPALRVQYADYAVWQREKLTDDATATGLGYWVEQLAGAPLNAAPPSDRFRQDVPTHRAGQVMFRVPARTRRRLADLAGSEGATLFMVALAAFQAVLARFCDAREVLVGVPVAGRTRAELEPLIGFFVNTLVLRGDLSGDPTPREALARTRTAVLGALAHQDLPFEKVVERLRPDRAADRTPLTQVAFQLMNAPADPLRLDGARCASFAHDGARTRFDLECYLFENPAGVLDGELDLEDGDLAGVFVHSADLFEHDTVARLVREFTDLLDLVVDHPDRPISELRASRDTARQLAWNDTAVPYDGDRSLPAVLADQDPDAIALVQGEHRVTYAELDRRTSALAAHLRDLGVGPEVRVGVALPRGIDAVVALIAVSRAGGAYVPIDPDYPAGRVEFMVTDSSIDIAITSAAHQVPLPARTRRVRVDQQYPPATGDLPSPRPDNVALVVYTSGSTGRPKGVEVTHRSVLRLVRGADYADLGPDSTIAHLATLSFDAATFEIWGALLHGATCAISPERVPTPAGLGELFHATRPAVVFLTTSLFNLIVDTDPTILHGVGHVLTGGEPTSAAHVARAYAALPDIVISNCYGPTEATTFTTSQHVPREVDPATVRVPFGGPIANTTVYVLDPALRLVPIGDPGELYIGGVALSRGYQGRPGLTAERYLPNPFAEGERIYRTGDRVRWRPDGTLEFLRRVDDQVKVRGHRVELAEVEQALRGCAGVRAAVAAVREDVPGERRLVGYLVPEEVPVDAGQRGDQVATWRAIFDETQSRAAADPTLHLDGWNSSFTGLPIPEPDMAEWVAATVARIAAFGARRVLEIGCGTGLLLWRLAPSATEYTATDFSAATTATLRDRLDHAGFDNVRLLTREATDFSGFAPGSVDLVVINSVVQYFPGADYLAEVVRQAVTVVRPGGTVFVGDVRGYGTLEAFHTAVVLAKAHEGDPAAILRQRLAAELADETELVIAPRLFREVVARTPAGGRVDVLPKHGHAVTEMNLYRYDVVITVGPQEPGIVPQWTNSIADLQATGAAEAVGVRGVPNARVTRDIAALRAIGDPSSTATAGRLLASDPTGMHPEELWALETGLEVLVRISDLGEDLLDVVLARPDVADRIEFPSTPPGPDLSLAELTNDPLRARRRRDAASALIPAVRAELAGAVPGYLIPTEFVLLDAIPLTANGKADRRALPAPGDDPTSGHRPPRTPVESALVDIWQAVLGRTRVGVDDDFFALGGHSLLAMQVLSRVRTVFDAEIPLRDFMDGPTVADLAASLRDAKGSGVTPPRPVSRDRVLPLSFAQQRLWFIDQLLPGSPLYHMHVVQRLTGTLDIDALQHALTAVVSRHEVLRTRYVEDDGVPRQIVMAAPDPMPLLVDEVPDSEIRARVDEEIARPFDLSADLAIRAHVFRISATDHVLVLVTHHIASDGWSAGLFNVELAEAYRAALAGEPATLPELPIQYADHAVWQREQFQGQARERQLAYWTQRLHGLPTSVDLPTDHPRPPVLADAARSHVFRIPAELRRRVADLGAEARATVFTVLLAAYQVLLGRHSGTTDVPVGTPVAGRPTGESEKLIGLFVNTLVLRADLSGDPDFREVLARVREDVLGAFAHQDLPFEQLVERLRPERDQSRHPLVQALFQLMNAPGERFALSGLVARAFAGGSTRSDLDLQCHLFENPAGLLDDAPGVHFDPGDIGAVLIGNAALFTEDTLRRWAEHYLRLLDAVVTDPGLAISAAPVLSERDTADLLALGRGQVVDLPGSTVVDEFLAHAAATPDAVAVRDATGETTFGELAGDSLDLAHHLRSLGVAEEHVVALWLPAGRDFARSILAILRAGAAYLPIDLRQPESRVDAMVTDAGARVVVTTSEHADKLPEGVEVVLLDRDPITAGQTTPPEITRTGGSAAYVIFTSGSTGRPKGVQIHHSGLSNVIQWHREHLNPGPGAVVSAVSSIGFDISVCEIWMSLTSGATLAFAGDEDRQSPTALLDWLASTGVTHAFLPTPVFEVLADRLVAAVPTLVEVFTGGDVLRRLPVERGTVRWRNEYGPTECSVFATQTLIGADIPTVGSPIGTAIANTDLFVLDGQLRLVPRGVPGELYLGGVGVARGYIGQPGLTAARFVPSPFGDGARLYRTGDRARWSPDGTLEFLGRTDNQVQIRGFRVEPAEVEAALMRHPGVDGAVVKAEPDHQGTPRLAAYVVPTEDDVTPAALRSHLTEHLPHYLVPSVFRLLDAFPLTSNGKLDRRALVGETVVVEPYVAPRDDIESRLCHIWQETLELPKIGINDNFFALGGHSMIAVTVVTRIRAELDPGLPLVALFTNPTVAELAAQISEGASPR
ncbi:non-ribosomal peptide synthetase [Actinokineospora globicatena]|uniref:non-ribosomal peptide synthetase n=1 Tax=Actinokineospora globicatena TaxID=103729 RepID=UPI0020A534FC|nr:non-ribosomal peptide synthetase [Actinokineospora globicatena]MCP2303056.1 amino acid adenylation domain-containing protein [Actinokineospora globicatena]GLW79832.1 hypothetical protein Aglo01_43130 [Actinokineospora globicatena]GLW85758.1 hypothetical protein Aglo02_33980 [Actinokineospora globicatena]